MLILGKDQEAGRKQISHSLMTFNYIQLLFPAVYSMIVQAFASQVMFAKLAVYSCYLYYFIDAAFWVQILVNNWVLDTKLWLL